MNRARLHFATASFLSEMRRQAAVAMKPTKILALDDYPPEQRSALMKAIEKAVNAADPTADKAFEDWQAKRGV